MKKCLADIDVVGINTTEKTAVIGECKFKNSAFGKSEYETLLDRARLVAPYRVSKYLIFSLGGVTDWMKEHEDDQVQIVTMDMLYEKGK